MCLLASCGGGQGPDSAQSPQATARAAPAAATVATFAEPRGNYSITRSGAGFNVRHNASGSNTLVGPGINLKFSDLTVNTGMGDVSNSITPANLRTLTELYVAFFNRMPDADGLSYWIGQFNAGQSIEQIAGAFYAAALQFSATTGYTSTMTNADFVKIVYKNVLGRSGALAPPDADVQYWANQLSSGAASRGTLVNTMLSAAHGYASDATWSWVSNLLDNKATVANYFAVQQGLNYNTPEDSINKTMAIAAKVTQTATTDAVSLIGVSDSGFNLGGCVCLQGVSTGFAGNIETVAANVGSNNLDTGGSGGAGSGDGGSAGGGGLGKVLGGLVRVTDLSNGVVVGQATTDLVNGMVTIRTGNRTGPFLMTMQGQAGAKYFDEGLNQLIDFGPGNVLNALVDQWDEHVGVSPLTEAAYRYALNNIMQDPAKVASGALPLAVSGSVVGLTADQVRLANKTVLDAVNNRLTDKFQLASVKALPTPIAAGSANALSTSRYGLSAAVNGGLVQAANHFNPALGTPALKLVNDLARDLTDGRINGFALDGSQVGISGQTTYASNRLPVASMVGTDAVTLRFGANSLLTSQLGVDEESQINIFGSQIEFVSGTSGFVNCYAFQDDIALMSDGTVTVLRRFPTNSSGKCSFTFSAAENAAVVKIPRFLTDVKLLSQGGPVAFAVKTDGTVVGWGENYCGRLSPTLANGAYLQPQVVQGLRDITSMSTAWSSIIARDKSGNVFSWGFGGGGSTAPAGQTACGTGAFPTGLQFTNYQDTAIKTIPGLNNVLEVIAGFNNFALTTDGRVYGWGSGVGGMLANSNGAVFEGILTGLSVSTPTLIPGLTNVRQLALTLNTVFALLNDGTILAWGDDEYMLLGNGVKLRTLRPTPVRGLSGVAMLVGGGGATGVRMVKTDGTAIQWGRYNSGIYVPVVVKTSERVRYLVAKSGSFSVFFGSGRIGSEFDDLTDRASLYR